MQHESDSPLLRLTTVIYSTTKVSGGNFLINLQVPSMTNYSEMKD